MQDYILSLITGGAAAIVLSAAARALPDPLPEGSRVYLWLYRFTQNLLANWDLTKKSNGSKQNNDSSV